MGRTLMRPGVLHVVLSLGTGGTERLVIELCQRLQAQFRMAVCCLDEPGLRAHELTDRGHRVDALHRRPGFHPSLAYRIARIARRQRASVLHCHHYSPFVYGRLATMLAPRAALVFTEHGRLSDGPPSFKRRMVNPVLARLRGSLHAVSNALKESMREEGFPNDRIEVIHNGIDPGPAPNASVRQAVRRELNVPDEAMVVATVARLDPVKDLASLVHAFARVRHSRPDARLVVVGDGAERGRLEALAWQHGMAGGVSFLGDRRDVQRLLPAFDVYVNSSISEGVSLTILEGMAAGLPVVATRVGGTPEVVTDGLTGMLVPARNPAVMAAALDALCADAARRQSLGAAARASVLERFTIDRMVARYAGVYHRLAAC